MLQCYIGHGRMVSRAALDLAQVDPARVHGAGGGYIIGGAHTRAKEAR
jgi:hypothetical protein